MLILKKYYHYVTILSHLILTIKMFREHTFPSSVEMLCIPVIKPAEKDEEEITHYKDTYSNG